MQTWTDHLYNFYKELRPPQALPSCIDWLYPQKSEEVMVVVRRFLDTYYSDSQRRTLMLGINPGRFGAGITGVNFTAARQLTQNCGIEHPFGNKTELSAEFIYAMIEAYGGAKAFYSRFFIGSVCPLGFVKEGKNINYYDDKALLNTVEPFIIENLERLLRADVNREKVFCIGGEKNFKYLKALNERYSWFETILPLPHPRFIMQYNRSKIPQFIQQYLQFIQN